MAVALGIGALAAIASLSATLRQAIIVQARSLVGADLVLTSRQPFSDETEKWLRLVPGEQARETSFTTMVVLPGSSNATRLANARAISGAFPFYGQFEVEPPGAVEAFRGGKGTLVEQTLLNQYALKIGDPVRLGHLELPIAGVLKRVPGDTQLFGGLAPRIYLSGDRLKETQLLEGPSIARYRLFVRFSPDLDADAWVKVHKPELEERHLDADTVSRRKEDLGETFKNQEHFLTVAALTALLLGAIGMAAGIQGHLQPKIPHVAVLRCLGAGTDTVFAIYLVQALVLGAVGAGAGILSGILVQQLLPTVLSAFVPFALETQFQWLPALASAAAGFGLCALFGLLPLLPLRHVSPLTVLRFDFGNQSGVGRGERWFLYGVIALGIASFTIWRAGSLRYGMYFAGGLLAVFGLLTGLAWLLRLTIRRLTPKALPFAWRQGFANLDRPQNRTHLILVSVGLGTFLLLTMQLTRTVLLKNLFPTTASAQPNAILFDIQTDQREGTVHLLENLKLPLLDEASMITMRLVGLKGRPVDSWANDPQKKIPSWALRREYRSTWRTNLTASESLVKGTFTASVTPEISPIPISVEEGIARELQVDVGDQLVFDVQGVLMTNRVGSIRKVDWRQIRPNFFVVFPAGALDGAPSTSIMATHVSGPEDSANMQRELVKAYPNISVIDLLLVLRTLDSIVNKIGFAIQFMALATVSTGLVVMVSAMAAGRARRLRDAVLLRTLGASRRQIQTSLLAEHLALGALAAGVGTLMSLAATWGLTKWVFHIEMSWPLLPVAVAVVGVMVLTVSLGLLGARGLGSHPPLEVLRKES
ncbi:MAG TPA: FtsX-like permease family protein [Candidatus Limnocylindria bacterium]|nr:FtsX-like permease family protein [Candidatus Limnocylindria bacterium]